MDMALRTEYGSDLMLCCLVWVRPHLSLLWLAAGETQTVIWNRFSLVEPAWITLDSKSWKIHETGSFFSFLLHLFPFLLRVNLLSCSESVIFLRLGFLLKPHWYSVEVAMKTFNRKFIHPTKSEFISRKPPWKHSLWWFLLEMSPFIEFMGFNDEREVPATSWSIFCQCAEELSRVWLIIHLRKTPTSYSVLL